MRSYTFFHNSRLYLAESLTILWNYPRLSIYQMLFLETSLYLCFLISNLIHIKETKKMNNTFTKDLIVQIYNNPWSYKCLEILNLEPKKPYLDILGKWLDLNLQTQRLYFKWAPSQFIKIQSFIKCMFLSCHVRVEEWIHIL